MKHTFLAIAIVAAFTTVPAYAGTDKGTGEVCQGSTCNGGGTVPTATAGAAAGAVAGAAAGANAGASATNLNSNHIGVGVTGVNKNTNRNSLGVENHNANVGVNTQGQTLRNTNDLSNRNANIGVNKQGQGQLQGQGQQQAQDQANKQVMQYNEAEGMHYSGEYTVRQAPPATAPDIQPTVPCAIPLTGGGSGLDFGFSIGTAYIDKECEIRETVRLGMHGDAVSKSLANQVIQGKLLEYVREEDEMAQARMEEAKRIEGMATTNSVWDSPYL